jgi:undecaprenyl-diphosphatase
MGEILRLQKLSFQQESLRSKKQEPKVLDALYLASVVGDYGIIWVVISLIKFLFLKEKRWLVVFKLGLCGFLSILLSYGFKNFFKHPRPQIPSCEPIALRVPKSFSFPSGQSLTAFMCAILLPDNSFERDIYLVLSCLIAGSRVYTHRHYFSDVIFGAVIGLLTGIFMREALKRTHRLSIN